MSSDSPLPIMLWSIPRSCSTAFQRSFRERDDTICLHEPWIKAALFGPDALGKVDDSFAVDSLFESATFENAYQMIQALHTSNPGKIILSKDHAMCIVKPEALSAFDPTSTAVVLSNPTALSDDQLRRFRHTFIIRTPTKSIPSLHRAMTSLDANAKPHTGSFGFCEAELLHKYLTDLLSPDLDAPIIIDADDLVINPEGTLRVYCDAVGIDFHDTMLNWKRTESEAILELTEIHGKFFHKHVLDSTGFAEIEAPVDEKLPELVTAAITQYMPVYLRLKGKAVVPTS